MKKKKPNPRESLQPEQESPERFYELARTLHAKGQLDGALAYYLKAIRLNPEFAAAYHGAGNLYQVKRKLDDALKCFQRAIDLMPEVAVSHNNLANVLLEKGRFEQAIIHYHKALELQPDSPATYGNLAVAYYGLGHTLEGENRFDDAVNAYRKALQLNPQFKEVYYELGMLFMKREQFDRALACYVGLIELDPANAHGYNAAGTVLMKMGRTDEAETYYRKALQINPALPDAHNNLGTIYRDRGLLDDAVTCYQKAIQENPQFTEAYNNLGTIYRDRGQISDAVSHYQKAINLNADFAEAHWNLAFAYLLSGDFRNGWKEYEWRWKVQMQRDMKTPLWDGGDIAGRTILLYTEQGYGDSIQFIRYVPFVAERGAEVIVECYPDLIPLFKNIGGIHKLEEFSTEAPPHDVRCPLLRLPLIFDTTLEMIPANVPYIAVDTDRYKKWKDKIGNNTSRLKVGLVWSANVTNRLLRFKSFPLDTYAPILSVRNAVYYSLQKGEAAKEAKKQPEDMHLIDLTDEIADFSDTAALIENLDLVISVDTAVAHLAGAMGKPVWTLLPFAPDWRWLLNRNDSPWYPTMRLFRQPSPGDWESVIDTISDALKKKALSGC